LKDVPVIAYVFPLIGFFLAPIYPLVNSFVLSATEKMFHSPMASLLVFLRCRRNSWIEACRILV
jgi:hypothetical protein